MSTSADTSTAERDAALDARLARATVAVLAGGRSSEREVSLATAEAVAEALEERDERGPARVLVVEVDRAGRWQVDGRAHAPHRAVAALEGVDAYFLGLHGGEGEGGVLQGLLEAAGARFTGSGVAASALCLDKQAARCVAACAGLRVARGAVVDAAAEPARWGTGGWVVKPRRGGSSVGVRVAREPAELAEAIAEVRGSGDEALVEERVDGVEATCGVLGRADAARALVPVEIRPHAGRFFDYEEKYSAAGAAELCPPESLDEDACAELRRLSLEAWRALGCRGYARFDWIVPAAGPPVFLEANTLPGLTPRSLLPLEAAREGLGFRDLCLEILRLALEP